MFFVFFVKGADYCSTILPWLRLGGRRIFAGLLCCGIFVRVNSHKIKDRILLKKACHNGCVDSLEEIYRKYRPMICDFLKKRGATSIAEDVCQTVFAQLCEGKCNYDGTSDVKNYLFGVARNTLNQQLRVILKETHAKSQIWIDGDVLIKQTTHQCPAQALNTAESQKILNETIANLPKKSQQAIKLVYIDAIPPKKAAKKAKCNFSVFRNRLDYGLRILEKHLKKLHL